MSEYGLTQEEYDFVCAMVQEQLTPSAAYRAAFGGGGTNKGMVLAKSRKIRDAMASMVDDLMDGFTPRSAAMQLRRLAALAQGKEDYDGARRCIMDAAKLMGFLIDKKLMLHGDVGDLDEKDLLRDMARDPQLVTTIMQMASQESPELAEALRAALPPAREIIEMPDRKEAQGSAPSADDPEEDLGVVDV